jgi:hypothetical protein
MRLVYEQPILPRILEAITAAETLNKKIEYLEVTSDEWEQIRRETSMFTVYPNKVGVVDKLFGVRIKVQP